MMKVVAAKIFSILFFVTHCLSFSQVTGSRSVGITLPVVTLMDIEPSTDVITLNFTVPTQAGLPLVQPATNTTKWINYTSATTLNGNPRKISARITNILPGINVLLLAGNPSAAGGGVKGTPTPQITLTSVDQAIINGIRGAFTGNGVNNGHQLFISLATSNYSGIIGITTFTTGIVYTISE